jgi:hypothetical protein
VKHATQTGESGTGRVIGPGPNDWSGDPLLGTLSVPNEKTVFL